MHAVGNEHLGAVEHIVITITLGGGAHALQVRASIGFGHGDSCDLAARNEVGHVFVDLCFCASMEEMRRGHIGVHEYRDGKAAVGAAPQFLCQDDSRERIELAAAVFGAVFNAEQAKVAHFFEHVARHFAGFFPCICKREYALSNKAADGVTKHFVIGGEVG
jgi:hypothetical protein